MPIDYYAICETHQLRGPGVWRPDDEEDMRWFLVEHGGCDVRIYSEDDHRVFDYQRWHNKGE